MNTESAKQNIRPFVIGVIELSYPHEEFLLEMGFKQIDSKEGPFSNLGITYYINTDELEGYYWFFDTDDFTVNIHDFDVKKTNIIFKSSRLDYDDMISVSFFKSVYGESLSPYRPVTTNSLFTYYHHDNEFKFILHEGFPFLSVGVDYKSRFWKKYIPEHLNIDEKEMLKAIEALNYLDFSPRIEKISDEILSFSETYPGSELFYEVKAKEILSLTLNNYFERKNSKNKLNRDDDKALESVKNYIDDHYSSDIPQKLLCSIALMGKTKLKDSFKMKYGMTITEYIQRRRINVAEHMISSTDLMINEIAKSVGYNSHSRFSKLFKKYKGMGPVEFRNMIKSKTK